MCVRECGCAWGCGMCVSCPCVLLHTGPGAVCVAPSRRVRVRHSGARVGSVSEQNRTLSWSRRGLLCLFARQRLWEALSVGCLEPVPLRASGGQGPARARSLAGRGPTREPPGAPGAEPGDCQGTYHPRGQHVQPPVTGPGSTCRWHVGRFPDVLMAPSTLGGRPCAPQSPVQVVTGVRVREPRQPESPLLPPAEPGLPRQAPAHCPWAQVWPPPPTPPPPGLTSLGTEALEQQMGMC